MSAVLEKLPAKSIFLYGSYARGEEKEISDIDIAVIVDKIEGNYLELSADLNGIGRKIDPRIEPVLLPDTKDPSGFLETIIKTGKVFYQRAA
ncbi:MAG: nucleotidyltransferase domain-containing protein [Candidatus Wallbacteria bacterium]|nr:nucleotidyltransferase domain-containing protein [Candidatus Wallbacteria bacterium]